MSSGMVPDASVKEKFWLDLSSQLSGPVLDRLSPNDMSHNDKVVPVFGVSVSE
jgi:hypothetical protein